MASERNKSTDRQYANWLEVGFNRDEFVLDFGQSFDSTEAAIHTGIVTSPRSAQAFLDTLQHSVAEYRRKYPAATEGD